MKSVVAAGLVLAFCASASAGPTMPAPTPRPAPLQPDRSSDAERMLAMRQQKLHDKLLALRAEGLRLREADGGTLTAEHRAYLQAKLDALNAEAGAVR